MASVAKAMASPESGLEVRDRMWLKITIPNAFLGKGKKEDDNVLLRTIQGDHYALWIKTL